jgi:hypothetical protein
VLAAAILAEYGFGVGLTNTVRPLVWVTGLVTTLSAFLYLASWLRHMASYDIDSSLNKRGPGAGAVH